jgi:hypothetical protein
MLQRRTLRLNSFRVRGEARRDRQRRGKCPVPTWGRASLSRLVRLRGLVADRVQDVDPRLHSNPRGKHSAVVESVRNSSRRRGTASIAATASQTYRRSNSPNLSLDTYTEYDTPPATPACQGSHTHDRYGFGHRCDVLTADRIAARLAASRHVILRPMFDYGAWPCTRESGGAADPVDPRTSGSQRRIPESASLW